MLIGYASVLDTLDVGVVVDVPSLSNESLVSGTEVGRKAREQLGWLSLISAVSDARIWSPVPLPGRVKP